MGCTSTNLTVIMKASSGSGQSSCRAVWLIWAKQVDRSTADVLCLVSSPRGTSWGMGEPAKRRAQGLPNPRPPSLFSFSRVQGLYRWQAQSWTADYKGNK